MPRSASAGTAAVIVDERSGPTRMAIRQFQLVTAGQFLYEPPPHVHLRFGSFAPDVLRNDHERSACADALGTVFFGAAENV